MRSVDWSWIGNLIETFWLSSDCGALEQSTALKLAVSLKNYQNESLTIQYGIKIHFSKYKISRCIVIQLKFIEEVHADNQNDKLVYSDCVGLSQNESFTIQ